MCWMVLCYLYANVLRGMLGRFGPTKRLDTLLSRWWFLHRAYKTYPSRSQLLLRVKLYHAGKETRHSRGQWCSAQIPHLTTLTVR